MHDPAAPADPFRPAVDHLFEAVRAALRDVPWTTVEHTADRLLIRTADDRCVSLDRRDPIAQVWLADGHATWHFERTTDGSDEWRDTRGHGALPAILGAILSEHGSRPVAIA